jgi:mRNA interferase MazF
MEKQPAEWNNVKKQLRTTTRDAPLVSEWDVWWIHIGENIGTEINGKSAIFSRPAIIFKKLTAFSFVILPMTTVPKVGNWYVPIYSLGRDQHACLHQVRMIDYRRLSSKMGTLDEAESGRVQNGFWNLYGKKYSPLRHDVGAGRRADPEPN